MWEIIFLLIVFVFVIGSAYFLTKKLASLGALRMQGKNMKILETLQLNMNQMIYLIRVGDKTLLIGVSKDRITYLLEVESDLVDLSSYETPIETVSFEDYLKKLLTKKK